MKRRNFLKLSTPLVLGGMSVNSFATPRMLTTLSNCAAVGERVLVLVQLFGGNDGLNTLVPIDQHAAYMGLRPTIGYAQSDLTQLDSTLAVGDQIGLPPSMLALKDLYDAGQLNVIQGVSYTGQNRSHFTSTDIYLTGGDGSQGNSIYQTGWMGRYLQTAYPGAASGGQPNFLDPLGIQLGDRNPSVGFYTHHNYQAGLNLYGTNPYSFAGTLNSVGAATPTNLPADPYGAELQNIVNIENSTSNYASRITSVYGSGTNVATYPSDNYLATQLKTAARLIAGGSTTKIYLTRLTGWDTHDGQVESGAPTTGWHATSLRRLTEALRAFNADLVALGIDQRVLTVTFSEFGRTAVENGSLGTDHGTLAPMFLTGTAVQPGITGTNVDLSNLAENGTQLTGMQHDYRQVYATLLQDWLGASDVLTQAAGFDTSLKLPLVAANQKADPSCYASGALPVRLLSFTATYQRSEEMVLLEWTTTDELNHEYTDVERSADGRHFERVAALPGRGRQLSDVQEYHAEDDSPLPGLSYYRLRHVDYDGTTTYSETRSVDRPEAHLKGQVRLSPNPAVYDAQLTLTLHRALHDVKLSVVSAAGMIHRVQRLSLHQGFNKLAIDAMALPAGQYWVRLEQSGRPPLCNEALLVLDTP